MGKLTQIYTQNKWYIYAILIANLVIVVIMEGARYYIARSETGDLVVLQHTVNVLFINLGLGVIIGGVASLIVTMVKKRSMSYFVSLMLRYMWNITIVFLSFGTLLIIALGVGVSFFQDEIREAIF